MGILDLLLQQPTLQDRYQQVQGMLGGSAAVTPGGTQDTVSGAGTLVTGGDTAYPYQTWDKPYSGTPPNLVTRRGITLQRGPMRSLLQIARESDYMPGTRELGLIGGGFRQTQPDSPYAAPEDMSWHEQALAIDAGAWSKIAELNRALLAAGWNQFDRSYEPWHYSYGVTG